MPRKGRKKTASQSKTAQQADKKNDDVSSTEDIELIEERCDRDRENTPSNEEVRPASPPRRQQRVIAAGEMPTPEATLLEKVSGELMQKFEMMFFEYQMDVSRAATEAIRDAMGTVHREVRTLGERVTEVERARTAKGAEGGREVEEVKGQNKDGADENAVGFRRPDACRNLFNPPVFGRHSLVDRNKNKLKIIKDWGLKYDGSSKSIPIERFLFRVETLQKRHEISQEDLCANFHVLLDGTAQEWFWLYMEEHSGDEVGGFENLRDAL